MKQAGVDSGACGYEQYSVYRWLGERTTFQKALNSWF